MIHPFTSSQPSQSREALQPTALSGHPCDMLFPCSQPQVVVNATLCRQLSTTHPSSSRHHQQSSHHLPLLFHKSIPLSPHRDPLPIDKITNISPRVAFPRSPVAGSLQVDVVTSLASARHSTAKVQDRCPLTTKSPPLLISKLPSSTSPASIEHVSLRGTSSSKRRPTSSPSPSTPTHSILNCSARIAAPQKNTVTLHLALLELTYVLKTNHDQQMQQLTALC